MDDLRRRFDDLDRVPVPDLWNRIEAQARTTPVMQRVDATGEVAVASRPASGRAVALLAAVMLIAALLVGAMAIGSGLLRRPAVVHPSTPVDPGPVARNLEPAGSLSEATQVPSAVALADGRVLVFPAESRRPEIWDPESRQVSTVGAMARERDHPEVVLLADGRVLVVGGDVARDGQEPTAEVFDPVTATFTLTPSSPSTVDASTVVLADGRVLLAGGLASIEALDGEAPQEAVTAAELFDPATGLFEPTGAMQRPRVGHRLELLADGRVLVLGGYSDQVRQAPSAAIELYDTRTGTFELADRDPFVVRPSDPTVRLADGRLVVLQQPGWGAFPIDELTLSIVIYDPERGLRRPGPSLQPEESPVYDVHEMVRLSEERLLLVGYDKASYEERDFGILSRGWVGTLDLTTGALEALAIRETSGGTAVPLESGEVLLVGGLHRAECTDPSAPSAAASPCMVASPGIEIVR